MERIYQIGIAHYTGPDWYGPETLEKAREIIRRAGANPDTLEHVSDTTYDLDIPEDWENKLLREEWFEKTVIVNGKQWKIEIELW